MSKIVGIVQVKGGAGRSTVSTNLAATVDSVTADLYADRAEAKKVNQFSASIAALMHIAKLHGLITDKQKVDVDVDVSMADQILEARKRAGILSLAEENHSA
tara:strand:+ start:191 stop:496 length:306 start_codon:yes stop_codon:yes gene_type:complete